MKFNHVKRFLLAKIIHAHDSSKIFFVCDTHLCSEHCMNTFKDLFLPSASVRFAKRAIKWVFLYIQERWLIRNITLGYFSTDNLSRLTSIMKHFFRVPVMQLILGLLNLSFEHFLVPNKEFFPLAEWCSKRLHCPSTILAPSGQLISSPMDNAHLFNKFFVYSMISDLYFSAVECPNRSSSRCCHHWPNRLFCQFSWVI